MVDLGLAAKARPCMIISTDFRDNERAVVTYVPRLSRSKGRLAHGSDSIKSDFDYFGGSKDQR